jgi:hypothetical protein
MRPNRVKVWLIVKSRLTGAGSGDFARERCRFRVEYVAWQRKQESLEDGKISRRVIREVGPVNDKTTDDSLSTTYSCGLRDSHPKLNYFSTYATAK